MRRVALGEQNLGYPTKCQEHCIQDTPTGQAGQLAWAGRSAGRIISSHFLFLFSPLGTLLLIIYHGGHPLQVTIHNINFMLLKYRRISESSQQSHASSDKDSEQNGQHSPKKVSKGEKKHKHRLAGG